MDVDGPNSVFDFDTKSVTFKDGIVLLCNDSVTVTVDAVSIASRAAVSGISSSSAGIGGTAGRRLQSGATLHIVTNVQALSSFNAYAIYVSASSSLRQSQFIAAMQQRLGWTPSNINVAVQASPPSSNAPGLPAAMIGAVVGAITGALILFLATFYGCRCLKRWQWRRQGLDFPTVLPPPAPLAARAVAGYPVIAVPMGPGFANPLVGGQQGYPAHADAHATVHAVGVPMECAEGYPVQQAYVAGGNAVRAAASAPPMPY